MIFCHGSPSQFPILLCNPMDHTVHRIIQARILEWVAVPFSRGSSQPRDWPRSSTLQVDSLPAEPQAKSKNSGVHSLSLLQQIFPTQELNWGLLHCRWILYQLSYQGSLSWENYGLNMLNNFSTEDPGYSGRTRIYIGLLTNTVPLISP